MISLNMQVPQRRSWAKHLAEVDDFVATRPQPVTMKGHNRWNAPEDPDVMFKAMYGWDPYPWQSAFLRKTDACRPCSRNKNAIVARRQGGKSRVVAVRAVRRLLRYDDQEVLILAKTERQAKRLNRRITRGLSLWCPKPWLVDNMDEVELPNGNTLICLPGGNPEGIRSYSPTLLLLDEAAFVSEELITAISPMLASTRGDWDMISTPNGPAGTFYEAMEGKQSTSWERSIFTADDAPALDKDFLEDELDLLGEARYLQEYYCKFVAASGAYFSLQSVDALLEGDRWAGSKSANGHRPALEEEWDLDDLDEALDPTRHADKSLDKARFFD